MAEKKINSNGYEYADLELPSGTLWATCNVGAKKPTDYGLYFQWGDTIGYSEDQVGTGDGKKYFEWADYKFSIGRSSLNFSKYTNTGDKLELEDDAAHVHMGGDWHMPSSEQIQELIDNATSAWTTQDGIIGGLFTSKKNPSKSIFIPAAGYAWYGSVKDKGDEADIWSYKLNAIGNIYGQHLNFRTSDVNLYGNCRDNGFSVRGVIG